MNAYVGDRVVVMEGKYACQEGVVTYFSINHNPALCIVAMGNGKEIAVFEDELSVLVKQDPYRP